MGSRFRHVALVGKYHSLGIGAVLDDIGRFLLRKGLEVSIERDTALNTGLTDYPALTIEQLGHDCDLAVVLGGDGTMLGIARTLAPHGTPMIGINQGRLGFITDVTLDDEFPAALGAMIDGDHVEEHRTMLVGSVWRDGMSIYANDALNDVVVSRGGSASMVELKIDIGPEFVSNIRADGLIVATPTGSTAYALSAGGPIMHPGVAAWVMMPIAPHDLSNRPIVLPDSGEIAIEVVAGRDVSVSFDNHNLASLLRGDRITVRRSPHQVRFLHPAGWSYYATLRRKLHWNAGAA